MHNVDSVLVFDGIDDYIEIPDSPDFSVATTGQLTVSAWIRTDVLTFPIAQSTGYVHWMGKGEPGRRSRFRATDRLYPLQPSEIWLCETGSGLAPFNVP